METFMERNHEDHDGGHCNKDQCNSGAYWLGAFVLFVIIFALLWWFRCNLLAAFVIALLLAIIVGWAIYAWETYDDGNCNGGKKKKKQCNNGWSVFLGALAMVIVWIIILYIIYLLVRRAIVDEKCCPTPCEPKCEPECPKKDC